MASPARRLSTNVDGDFFVDDSCIDCGTCRWVAPASFEARGAAAAVTRQPAGDDETRRALMAVVACPTASIGFSERHDARAARDAFPDPVADRVYHCGFHAEESYGAASWLIARAEGNVLVDSPRYSEPLARRLEALGGVRWIFLTHRDDVADHARWAERFSATRVLHADDVTADTRDVEQRVEGEAPVSLAPDLLVIPTPGHTRGSACLLFEERVLFTGDHLAGRERAGRGELYAFRRACWHSWSRQVESMARLHALLFEQRRAPVQHVLPGHGWPVRLSPEEMRAALLSCIEWMRRND